MFSLFLHILPGALYFTHCEYKTTQLHWQIISNIIWITILVQKSNSSYSVDFVWKWYKLFDSDLSNGVLPPHNSPWRTWEILQTNQCWHHLTMLRLSCVRSTGPNVWRMQIRRKWMCFWYIMALLQCSIIIIIVSRT